MCGITGFFSHSKNMDQAQLLSTVKRMTETLISRGPDSFGTWTDPKIGLALGHRRLAIIDLSQEGHQPMHSACGRYVMSFNGEIYNHKTLRDELVKLGHHFRGYSDTEVLLAVIVQWGFEAALKKLNGMFAMAVLDREEAALLLARDRFGEKPLYYGWCGSHFLFGSELKALFPHPDFQKRINRDALTLYMRHNYIPSPYSIYEGIYKLVPGSFLKIPLSGQNALPSPKPYWSFKTIVSRGLENPSKQSEEEVIETLKMRLTEAVKLRMEADVPMGAFLSGGIDSSLIVALMQSMNDRPVKTFTIGFDERKYNEACEAKKVAQHLGTDHTELYVSAENALDIIPRLPQIYDEPFSDSSQIPTYLVSELARRHVTVSLSGDGGDELFGGYSRYFIAEDICRKIRMFSKKGRSLAVKGLNTISRLPLLSNVKLERMSDILAVEGEERMYCEMISHHNHPSELVLESREPETIFSDEKQWIKAPHFIQKMMYVDTLSYLPDDILVKIDRASMALGLESRIPFLDHHLVDYAWQIPLSFNVDGNKGKKLLRKILGQYIPEALVERPKMGFGVPLDEWLRGPLREWCESLLDEKRLKNEGLFDPAVIRKRWKEHLSGKSNHHYFLWTVLMFQAWVDEWQK